MAGLMQYAHEPGERIGVAEARGDADVTGQAAGEGMLAFIEAAAVEGKPHRLHHFQRELALLGGRELAGDLHRGTPRLQLDGFVDQPGQTPADGREDGIDLLAAQPGAEFVGECVVRVEVERLAQQAGLVAHQVDDFFQVRREQREIAFLARFAPFHFGARRGFGQPRNDAFRGGDRMVALTPHLAQIRGLPILERPHIGIGAIQEPGDARRDQQRVSFGFQRRQLFATQVGTAARHHHGRIPTQNARGAPKGMQATKFLLELLVRR
jgi:hypothetical protein